VRQAYPEIEAVGGRALAVSVGHGFQAEALIAAGMPFPLLIDREKRVAHALGVRASALGVLNPRGWWNYLRALLHGHRQGRIPAGGATQMPGLAILDSDGAPVFVHRGWALGDYPPLPSVIRRLRATVDGHGAA